MTITLIADDLTGACDAGAHFSGRGRVGVFVDATRVDVTRAVAVVDTESRALSPSEAGARVRAVARDLRARIRAGFVFKKIDSTLRGPVTAEIEALLEVTGRPTALVCSSFPALGRTVTGGVLCVDGLPAHTSAIGRDPAYPGATSVVTDILRRGAARPVRHLSLESVRGGSAALKAALRRAAGGIIAADAETEADLDALAAAGIASPDVILAGSAGLAQFVARHLGHAGSAAPMPGGRAWLIVAGSLHPVTRAQIHALEAAGVPGAVVDERSEPDTRALAAELGEGRPVFLATADGDAPTAAARRGMAVALAATAARLLEQARPDLVAVSGGDTAHALMGALGADHIELTGAPASGLGLGELVTRAARSLPWLSKAGGFGAPDLFTALLEGTA